MLLLPADLYCHVTVLVCIGFSRRSVKLLQKMLNDRFAGMYNVLTVVSSVYMH